MTPCETIAHNLDGALLVRMTKDETMLYVWHGGPRVRMHSTVTGEELDSYAISELFERNNIPTSVSFPIVANSINARINGTTI